MMQSSLTGLTDPLFCSNLFTAFDAGKHAEIRKQLADRYSNSTVLKSEILHKITERAETFTTKCVAAGSADVYVRTYAWPTPDNSNRG